MSSSYHLGQRIKIVSPRPIGSGKLGIITGIFCAGQPDREHYLVHLDCDHDLARIYHVYPEDIEPIALDTQSSNQEEAQVKER